MRAWATLEREINNRRKRRKVKEKVNEGKERVFFGPRRGIGYSLLAHVLINMGFPYLATWGRAFSAVENPLPLYRPYYVPTLLCTDGGERSETAKEGGRKGLASS